jgi:hypothetical protein
MTTQRDAQPVCSAQRGDMTIASDLDALPAEILVGTIDTHATFEWLAVYAQP